MNYKKLTKAQAKNFADDIDALPEAAFLDLEAKWQKYSVDDFDPAYSDLRSKVIAVYQESKPNGGYAIDVNIGLCLYDELSVANGFTNVMANDDDVWRYLSCIVFPDITHLRYPPSKKDVDEGHRLNPKRFYAHTRRIWLKHYGGIFIYHGKGLRKQQEKSLKTSERIRSATLLSEPEEAIV